MGWFRWPRPFDYRGFIGELRDLVRRGKLLERRVAYFDQADFKYWHHAVADSISRIQAHRYTVNTRFGVRTFSSSDPDRRIGWRVYANDLKDTIGELEHIIDLYDRYGDPKRSTLDTDASTSLLEKPENVTLPWLWNHMSVRGWLLLIGVLATTFGLGMSAGKWLH